MELADHTGRRSAPRGATSIATLDRERARPHNPPDDASPLDRHQAPGAADLPLPGDPPLVLLGSGGWLPNRDGTRWFLEDVWPEVHARVPGAVLHLYATRRDRPRELPESVHLHPPPVDSREAFAPNTILVIPLRIASGIRMKILEAWARGVPVIATPEAAEGLSGEGGLLLAEDAAGLAGAISGLGEAAARLEFGAVGRSGLAAAYNPGKAAAALRELYMAHGGHGD